MIHALIMAGGSGTRFWPASRRSRPKQLLNLVDTKSMIQATVARLGGLLTSERIVVMTNGSLTEQIAEQLPDLDVKSIVGEPCKRDTAPCVGLAAALMVERDPEATMVVMPADHVIERVDVFQQAVEEAVALVEQDPQQFVTFGIRPSYAAESFGYIECGDPVSGDGALESTRSTIYQVRKFREKPDADTARQYLKAGSYFWNAGIFVWKARAVLAALEQYEPAMFARLKTIQAAIGTDAFDDVLEQEFTAIDGKSIDYAVMERYPKVLVMEAPFDWDDLGSWRSLARMRGNDQNNNTLVGKILAQETSNSILCSDDQHLVATVGVDNLIVVHTENATLVIHQNAEESVRDVVKRLESEGWDEYL